MKIYVLTFSNGKRYVGQTLRTLPVRFSQHRRMAAYGSKLPVHCAWRKHGEPIIELVSEHADIHALHAAERALIAEFATLSPNGYNVSYGGDTAPSKSPQVAAKIAAKAKGRTHSDEAKARISAASKARWSDPAYCERVRSGIAAAMTDELRAMMSARRKGQGKGRVVSEETRAKMRGRVVSEETRQKMSQAAIGRKKGPRSETTRNKIAENTRAAWRDPALTEQRLKAIKASKQTPEVARKMADAARASWADPKVRERRLAGLRAAHARRKADKSSIA